MSEFTMDRLRENLESLKMKNTLEILDNYPTGRWLKIPQDWAEAMESGLIAAYPWEVSEGEYCWLTEKQAKVKLPEEGFGKPSKWGYWWMRYVGSKCEI